MIIPLRKMRYEMKIKQIAIIVFIFAFIFGCSDDCENENPTVLLLNNGTDKADIQVKTSGGNTENINNIEPGTFSEKRSFAPGEIEFTIAIQGVDDPIVYNLRVFYCNDYTVTINADNSVTGSVQSRD
jgi:hypothetical protein